MLTGDVSSLLYRVLRDKLNLIYGIKLDYQTTSSYVLSNFEVTCQFENSKRLYTELMKLLRQFISGKFDDNLLSRSKERLTIMDTNACKENTEYIQTFYSNQYILTGSISMTPAQAIKKVRGISKSRLLEIARRIFNPRNLLVVCETK